MHDYQEKNPEFSFSKITQLPLTAHTDSYFAKRGREDSNHMFVYLEKQPTVAVPTVGWKMHIAVKDNPKANLEKAWNIIKDIAIQHKVASFKVYDPSAHFSKGGRQKDCEYYMTGGKPAECGRQITVYANGSEHIPWIEFAATIHVTLKKHDVLPDSRNPADAPLLGTDYIGLREDGILLDLHQSGDFGIYHLFRENYCLNLPSSDIQDHTPQNWDQHHKCLYFVSGALERLQRENRRLFNLLYDYRKITASPFPSDISAEITRLEEQSVSRSSAPAPLSERNHVI